HYCLNVVAGAEGEPVAVLIRALEPTEGLPGMRKLRTAGRPRGARQLLDTELCAGPARLCEALDIDLGLNGIDLTTDSRLLIELSRTGEFPGGALGNSARIGVDYAG